MGGGDAEGEVGCSMWPGSDIGDSDSESEFSAEME